MKLIEPQKPFLDVDGKRVEHRNGPEEWRPVTSRGASLGLTLRPSTAGLPSPTDLRIGGGGLRVSFALGLTFHPLSDAAVGGTG